MLRKFILSLASLVCFGMAAQAQSSSHFCGTDEEHRKLKALYPQIADHELALKEQIQQQLQRMDLSQFARKGASVFDDVIYDIPVVVHIIHNYNAGAANASRAEYLSDNEIYEGIASWNRYFLKQNADTTEVINPYKGTIKVTYNVDSLGNPAPISPVRYIGNANIRLHLATKDPTGKPTTGITRIRSSLFNNAGDQAKMQQWSPSSYLNIWVVQGWSSDKDANVIAYALYPSGAAERPYYDGVITVAEGLKFGSQDATVPHEIAHWLNLPHVWNTQQSDPGEKCGDDGIDDTPPTKGHGGGPGAGCIPAFIYDTVCARGGSVPDLQHLHDTLGWRNINKTLVPHMDKLNYLGIEFVAKTNINIDSVTIYPVAQIGDAFQITLRKYGFAYATYDGIVTTNSGPQRVPVNFAVTADSGYVMTMTVNPGMLRDSVLPGTTYPTSVANTIELKNDQFGGFYNYFYNWKVKRGSSSYYVGKPSLESAHRATTTNDGICFQTFSFVHIENLNVYPAAPIGESFTIKLTQNTTGGSVLQSFTDTVKTPYAAQDAKVNFQILTPGKYCLSLAVNPGMLRPEYTPTSYFTQVPAVITINKDTTKVGTDSNAKSYYNYLFNMGIRYGYARVYMNSLGGDSVVDYPDTVNAQNIMDYTFCDRMFTHGQALHMRAALLSPSANRSNLITPENMIGTGIWLDASGTMAPRPDLKPVPDFSVGVNNNFNSQLKVFGCADGLQNFYFKDRSWRDTVVNWNWSFSNGAITANSTDQNVVNRFTEPGWVTTTLTVAGNNTGDTTVTNSRSIYVADTNAMQPIGYWQEFSSEADMAQWPIFNYFGDPNHQWQTANVGYYDDKAIVFKNFDNRSFLQSGSPLGQYADFYTPAFNVAGGEFGDNANLNFMSAGAFRTSVFSQMNDTLEIAYSTNCGTSWTTLTNITKGNLGNYGTIDVPFAPLYHGDWKAQSIDLPAAARKERVYFRFRYKVGVSKKYSYTSTDDPVAAAPYFMGTGNNFYIDRISISNNPLGIAGEVAQHNNGITVAPNPTNGSATVTIAGGQGEAVISVTDITGKLVFKTSKQMTAQGIQVEIPADNISAKGLYLIQVVANGKSQTQKLVAY